MHDYPKMTSNRGIGMSTIQLIESNITVWLCLPEWLKERQREQILEFLKVFETVHTFKQYEESFYGSG